MPKTKTRKAQLPVYRIPLEKQYASKNGKTVVTIDGSIYVRAKDAAEALSKYEKMTTKGWSCLQTTDARIVWDWEEAGWTEEEINDKDLDYVDCSFGIPEDAEPELVETSTDE